MRKIILGVTFLALLASCNSFTSSTRSKVVEQKLVYDSLYNKFHKFDIQLYTTIEFDKNQITRKEYNDFSIVINKDTFALVPKVNDLKIKRTKQRLEIEYYSKIDFSSKIYENDSISKVIKNGYIISSEGGKIEKNKNYKLESLVTLSYKQADIKSKGTDGDM